MKNMLNIALLISCSCFDSLLNAGGNRLSDEETVARYAQCQEDYELAIALQQIEQSEHNQRLRQDLKHSRELDPRLYMRIAPQARERSAQVAQQYHAQQEHHTLAEQRRNADAKRKQQLIDERQSLWRVIDSLNKEIVYKRNVLNEARYSFEIEQLRIEIRHLEHQRSIAIKRCDYLDREIQRSMEHDDREIARRENEIRIAQ